MRTTLLGSLLTAVRHNVARGREDVRLFEEGSVYFDRPHGREPTAAEARSTPLPDERMHLGRADDRPAAAGLVGRRARRRRPTSSPPRARWRRCWARCACRSTVVRGDDPFLHPGRAARVLVGGEDAGWLGEVHPGVAVRVGPGPRRGLRARPRRRAPARRRRPALRGPDVVPGDPPGPRVLGPGRPHRGRAGRGRARRRRQAPARRARVRRLRARGPDVAGGAARVPRGATAR